MVLTALQKKYLDESEAAAAIRQIERKMRDAAEALVLSGKVIDDEPTDEQAAAMVNVVHVALTLGVAVICLDHIRDQVADLEEAEGED